jgi:hypothetical protein
MSEIIGVVVDKNFPDEEFASSLAAGVERYPDAEWMVRATDTRAREALEAVGVEPVIVPLDPRWKKPGGKAVIAAFGYEIGDDVPALDVRRLMRDLHIINTCTRVIVYRDVNSATSKWWTQSGHRTDHVRVVEHGTVQKRRKKGRNPQE